VISIQHLESLNNSETIHMLTGNKRPSTTLHIWL